MVNRVLVGKRVYLDANPIIYALESPNQFPGLIGHLLSPLQAGKLIAITGTITLTEVLTHPIRHGDSVLEHAYRQFLAPSS